MGVNIKVFRLLILLSSCALAGMITAMAGPVAFVGLAVPHMVRLAFKTSDNRILVPGALLVGAVVTCLCDLRPVWFFHRWSCPFRPLRPFSALPSLSACS